MAHDIRARIAELEAENVRQKATIEAQSAIIKQADAELAEVQALRFDLQHKLDDARAALAERERMLRLAWTETVQAESYYWKYHDNVDEWLADLRARAEEGSRDE
jgi:uncharacterized coiled-coil protein SlyX